MATEDQGQQEQAPPPPQQQGNGGRRGGPPNGGRGSLAGNSNSASSFADPNAQELNEQGAATQTQQSMQAAMERELAGQQVWDYEAPRSMLGPTGVPLIWVASNRADNRAVGFWIDEHQPGGQVFLGPGVELVARTADIEALLNQHLLVEVPEPRRWRRDPETGDDLRDEQGRRLPNPKYPAAKVADPTTAIAAQPGAPTPLGRNFDPDLFDEPQLQEIRQRQARGPRQLPAPTGGIVPGVTHPIS